MQKFRTLAAFFLVEKQQPRREEEENAKYYGHFGAGARTPLGPMYDTRSPGLTFRSCPNKNIFEIDWTYFVIQLDLF